MAKTSALRGTMMSCGVRELTGVSYGEPRDVIRQAFRQGYPSAAHVVFSDVVGRRYNASGELFAAYITENGLGTITRSPIRSNPNTYNRIAVWIWTPNKRACKQHLKDITPKT